MDSLEEALKPYQVRYFMNIYRQTSDIYYNTDKVPKLPRAKAIDVWNTFANTLQAALDETSLRLEPYLGETREDGSIFISVASYRDPTCPDSLQLAFERASNPELLVAGVVQQNCANDACMTGTGWAETRQWVKAENDLDCFKSFCDRQGMSKFCVNQIKGIRLREHQSYGPFFSRFLNSLLYRGENFYLQIDAHTEFRQGWDEDLRDQMKATPSYPFTVISNYPPGGYPTKNLNKLWAKNNLRRSSTPSALCGCKFETAGGNHFTVRLEQKVRELEESISKSRPRQSAFIAAGFFIAHGSFVRKIPFDPFMPYLFMGEEIALSVRFWTHGYDIYAPVEDVLRHEYVRKESPKFWESVNMIFSRGIHNDLTDLIIPRVHFLLKNTIDESAPSSLYDSIDRFSVGNKRAVTEYLEFVGIDLENLKQVAPAWCLRGTK